MWYFVAVLSGDTLSSEAAVREDRIVSYYVYCVLQPLWIQ